MQGEQYVSCPPVESLQSHFILTMSHWSSGLPVCFPSQGTQVQIPWEVLTWNRDSPVSDVSLHTNLVRCLIPHGCVLLFLFLFLVKWLYMWKACHYHHIYPSTLYLTTNAYISNICLYLQHLPTPSHICLHLPISSENLLQLSSSAYVSYCIST
jgi:hypothetical protein